MFFCNPARAPRFSGRSSSCAGGMALRLWAWGPQGVGNVPGKPWARFCNVGKSMRLPQWLPTALESQVQAFGPPIGPILVRDSRPILSKFNSWHGFSMGFLSGSIRPIRVPLLNGATPVPAKVLHFCWGVVVPGGGVGWGPFFADQLLVKPGPHVLVGRFDVRRSSRGRSPFVEEGPRRMHGPQAASEPQGPLS